MCNGSPLPEQFYSRLPEQDGGRGRLRIQVNQQDALPELRQSVSEIERTRSLTDSTLLVRQSKHARISRLSANQGFYRIGHVSWNGVATGFPLGQLGPIIAPPELSIQLVGQFDLAFPQLMSQDSERSTLHIVPQYYLARQWVKPIQSCPQRSSHNNAQVVC